MNRQQICEHVGKLITGEREATHGDPFVQFDTAIMLKGIVANRLHNLGITAVERQAIDMILTKISRIITGSAISDHWYDIVGYAAIAAEARDKETDKINSLKIK